MKSSLISMFSFALLFALAPSANACVPANCKELGPTKRSTEQVWKIRYFIHVDDFVSLNIEMDVVKRIIEKERTNPKPRVFRSFDHLFVPVLSIRLPPIGFHAQEYGIVQIEFDRNGLVTTENTSGQKLQGMIDDSGNLVLLPESPEDGLPFHLADKFRGWTESMTDFVPAYCTGNDDGRYRKGFRTSEHSSVGNFGCREWAYQLLDRNRPYIDVTSYEKDGTYIKEFYGWASFDEPRKPVIGKHYETWICLHDCPQGAAPGIIKDIVKWCKDNGYPIPERPKKSPMFPNADFPMDEEG